MPKTEFHYDIEQHFDTLSENETANGNVYTKEVNLISYNDADPVYDIRNWTHLSNGDLRMGKGITLSLAELKKLKEVLDDLEDLK